MKLKPLFLYAFLSVFVLIGLSSVASANGSTSVSISPSTQEVSSGEDFTVDIYVAPTEAIIGVNFDLSFDPSLVSVTGVEQGSMLDPFSDVFFRSGDINNDIGIVKDAGFMILGDSTSESGAFIRINFTATDEQPDDEVETTSLLDLDNVEVWGADANPTSRTVSDGSVTVVFSDNQDGSDNTLVYDDFNDEELDTNLGGVAGAMSLGELYDPTVAFTSGAGAKEGAHGLSLTYNFPSGQWCGYYSFFYANESGHDVSGYSSIQMWVKGATGGEKFKLEVADVFYDPNNYAATQYHKKVLNITTIQGFSGGLTTEWQKLVIPLSDFTGGSSQVDLTQLKQVSIIFDQTPRYGTVFIDLIEFITQGVSNQPPTASFTYSPSSPAVNEEVQFTDHSTDSDGSITNWSWNFGDGSTSTSRYPTHRYSVTDNYMVTLTVTDDGGLTDTATENIEVTLNGGGNGSGDNQGDDNQGGTDENTGSELVYDDFNDGELDTNLEGLAGPMSPGEAYDPTVDFTSDAREGAYALSLTYDFPFGQWCGYWSFANDDDPDDSVDETIDVSSYNSLKFYLKGALGGEKFKIELKSGTGEVSYYYVTNLGTEWNEIGVPFSEFQKVLWEPNPVDLNRLQQVNIVFNKSPRSGTVYIDQIRFTGGAGGGDNQGGDSQGDDNQGGQSNIRPIAYIGSIEHPDTVYENTMVVFSGYGEDPDGTIIGYRWVSSIDGLLSTLSDFDKTLSPGTHQIRFKVKDDKGTWSNEVTRQLSVTSLVAGSGETSGQEPESLGGDSNENVLILLGLQAAAVVAVASVVVAKKFGYLRPAMAHISKTERLVPREPVKPAMEHIPEIEKLAARETVSPRISFSKSPRYPFTEQAPDIPKEKWSELQMKLRRLMNSRSKPL